MKTKAALLLLTAPALLAGTTETIPLPPSSDGDWLKPLIDIRTRYEYGDIEGKDASHAWTFRERIGLETIAWHGFSALVEGEFSQAAVDDYHGGAPGANPFDPARALIADPQTDEINRVYLQYAGFDTILRVGRQRMIYDNAAFIGNVGWRQNEQTFDAVSLVNKSIDGLTLNYGYLNQVNRIFGSGADGPPPNAADIAASVHLINASYTGVEGLTLGSYAYLMNFPALGAWDNNTFGISVLGDVAGFTLYGELAWQDKAGVAGNSDAFYAHATASRSLKTDTFDYGSFTLGIEHLGSGLKTPLATLHAFNGFADVFIAGRANGSHNGLTDTYLAHSLPVIWDIKWSNIIHLMADNGISSSYGWEYDSVLVRKFADHFTAIAKFAWFTSGSVVYTGAAALPDATRFSVELNYIF